MMEKKVWLAKVLINMLKDKIKYEWEAKEGYEKTEKRNTRQGGGRTQLTRVGSWVNEVLDNITSL